MTLVLPKGMASWWRRPFPYLDEGLRETNELLARRSQVGAVAVAHEQLPADLVLQRADARAHRRLRDMQPVGRPEKAAGIDDFKEGPGAIDIQGGLSASMQ